MTMQQRSITSLVKGRSLVRSEQWPSDQFDPTFWTHVCDVKFDIEYYQHSKTIF